MSKEHPVLDWKPVQKRLKALGFYSGVIDGLRGPLTNQAIVAFKRSVGFVARDFYGPLTHVALMQAPAANGLYPCGTSRADQGDPTISRSEA